MFILDSLMIAGIRWALETALTAAEAEMNDDSVLREQLLEAEMRREMGEISDEQFEEIEADLLARIREIKERREGGSGPLAFGGAQPMETTDGSTFQVEASVSGDFYDPASAPHTTVVEQLEPHAAVGGLVGTRGDETIEILDMEPGDAAPPAAAVVEPARAGGAASPTLPHARKKKNTARRRSKSPNPSVRGRILQPAAVGRVPRSGPGVTRRKRTVEPRAKSS